MKVRTMTHDSSPNPATSSSPILPDAEEESYVLLDPEVETGDVFTPPAIAEAEFEHPDRCPACKYDLRGHSHDGTCSECGAVIQEALQEREDRHIRFAETVSKWSIYRWILLSGIPLILWIGLARFIVMTNNSTATSLVVSLGWVTAIASTVLCTLKSYDELREVSIGTVPLIFVGCGTVNIGLLFLGIAVL